MVHLDDDSSIRKLESILKNRFGKGLEMSRLTEVSSVEPGSDFFFKNSDLVIPIVQENTYLGTAVVPEARGIDDKNINSLSTLVKMTLIPVLYSKFQALQENNLMIEEGNLASVTNSSKSLNDSLITDDFGLRDFQIATQRNEKELQLISKVIHLNGIKEISFKVAHQIHELDSRWAFLPFENIRNEFKSLDSLIALGNITIYVSSVLDLSLAEQDLLVKYKYHKLQNGTEGPLIVLASQQPLPELAIHPVLSTELVEVMHEQTFEVNRAPLTYAKLKEAVEILFFASDK